MRLNDKPFEKIKAGNKTVELRLYDEKRRKVKIGGEPVKEAGDEIEFIKITQM